MTNVRKIVSGHLRGMLGTPLGVTLISAILCCSLSYSAIALQELNSPLLLLTAVCTILGLAYFSFFFCAVGRGGRTIYFCGILLSLIWIYSLESTGLERWVVLIPAATLLLLLLDMLLAVNFASRWKYQSWLFDLLEWMNIRVVFIVALMLRLLWVFAADTLPVSDFLTYEKITNEILNGHSLVHSSQPTGAPIIFAFIYLIFGHHLLVALIVMALLGAVTGAIVQKLTFKITGNVFAGTLAGLVYAFWPSQIVYSSLLSSDVPFTLLVFVSILLFSYWSDGIGGRWIGVFLGVVLGLAHWVRPLAPVYLVGILLAAYLVSGLSIRFMSIVANSVTGFFVLILPIFYLNYSQYGAITPLPILKGGAGLMMGVSSTGGDQDEDYKLLKELGALGADDVTRAKEINITLTRIAIDKIKKDPLSYLKVAIFKKPATLWGSDSSTTWSVEESNFSKYANIVGTTADIYYRYFLGASVIVLLWISSGGITVRGASSLMLMALLSLLVTGVHMIQVVQPRYHYTLTPYLAILVGIGFSAVIKRSTGKAL